MSTAERDRQLRDGLANGVASFDLKVLDPEAILLAHQLGRIADAIEMRNAIDDNVRLAKLARAIT